MSDTSATTAEFCAFCVHPRPAIAIISLEVADMAACDRHVEGNRWRTLGPDGLPPLAGRLCTWQHCSGDARWREKDRPPNAPLMGTYCDFHWDHYVQVASYTEARSRG